MYQGSSRTNIR